MTKSPGMKNDSPLPAKVAIIPKMLPIGRPRVATKTSMANNTKVTG